jgi:hypothetical protein
MIKAHLERTDSSRLVVPFYDAAASLPYADLVQASSDTAWYLIKIADSLRDLSK